jgi:hypothetical protein
LEKEVDELKQKLLSQESKMQESIHLMEEAAMEMEIMQKEIEQKDKQLEEKNEELANCFVELMKMNQDKIKLNEELIKLNTQLYNEMDSADSSSSLLPSPSNSFDFVNEGSGEGSLEESGSGTIVSYQDSVDMFDESYFVDNEPSTDNENENDGDGGIEVITID